MKHPLFAIMPALLTFTLALACSGSSPADPTATQATITRAAGTLPQTESQTASPLTLEPTRRTPIPTLTNPQISATQRAQVADIKTQFAPTPERVLPTPVPTAPVFLPPPTTPPMPVFPTPAPTPWLLPTLAPLMPTFPPPPTIAFPTYAPPTLVIPTFTPPTLVTGIVRKDFLGPISSLSTEATALRFFESGYDHTPGEDRKYTSVFSQQTTRYIDWQVDIRDVEVAQTTEIEVISKLFGANDEVLDRSTVEFELNPGTTYSWISLGHGWEEPGNWDTGDYWIEVSVDGELASAGGFEIVAGMASTSIQAKEFAVACGELREGSEDVEFDSWVAMVQALVAPPEVADYWSAYVDQFALQTDLGPNGRTQNASDRATAATMELSREARELLISTGCLSEIDVWLAREFVAANARLEGGYAQRGTVTVEQFAKACADIKITAPTMGGLDAMPAHFIAWWGQLVPPPGLGKYHSAIMDFYREWQGVDTGDPQDVDILTQLAVMEAAQALDGDDLEILLREGCSG